MAPLYNPGPLYPPPLYHPAPPHAVLLPPRPFHHNHAPAPAWPQHPDTQYRSPEARPRSRTHSGKARPGGGPPGAQQAEVDVHSHSNGGGVRSLGRRSRSRSGGGDTAYTLQPRQVRHTASTAARLLIKY